MVNDDPKEHKDYRVQLVPQVMKVLEDLRVLKEHKVPLVVKGLKVT
jgi:hypothetical protein